MSAQPPFLKEISPSKGLEFICLHLVVEIKDFKEIK